MSVNVGIIGCGGIAHFHIRGYKQAQAQIICVADNDEARAKSLAQELGCNWTTDYRKLLEDPRIECVSICTPNYLHREHAEAALAAGKHVLCEKTMTTNLEDAAALLEAVRKSRRLFQIGYMKRFVPAACKAKELVPRLGKLLSGVVRVYHPMSKEGLESAGGDFWLLNPSKGGGGVLVHSGSHMLDLMRFLAGDPIAVDAKTHFYKGIIDYYDTAYFQMAGDFTMFFESGWLDLPNLGVRDNGWDERIELTGEHGRLELFTMWWTRPDTEEPFVRFYSADDRTVYKYHPEIRDCFVEEVKAFVNAVKSGGPVSPDAYDGYMVQAIIDAVYKSGAQGRRIEIERLEQP
ncbi:MAG: Gfo/Idh/MocA family oxidoreductase [Armatimonadota bacterium]|nr:Gfo/Idh/MocA family oxidoreductase [Armatimonadota bacterium]